MAKLYITVKASAWTLTLYHWGNKIKYKKIKEINKFNKKNAGKKLHRTKGQKNSCLIPTQHYKTL